jgi:hypothetical protein
MFSFKKVLYLNRPFFFTKSDILSPYGYFRGRVLSMARAREEEKNKKREKREVSKF